MLRPGDIPAETVHEQPGHAIPADVFAQLITSLPELEAVTFREGRLAVQLLMDTGRRPGEISGLALDCLDRDRQVIVPFPERPCGSKLTDTPGRAAGVT